MANNKYTYEKDNLDGGINGNIPSKLSSNIASDALMNSVGLYSKSDIEKAKFSNFSRFGRLLDPYGRLNAGREYLFFVKPDLHICVPQGQKNGELYKLTGFSTDGAFEANGLTMNPQLTNNLYFEDLIVNHPDVVKELQYSLDSSNPFGHLLSFSVNSYLPLDSTNAETMDNPSTIYGTSYKYLRDSESSDEDFQFQLEFLDSKNLDAYNFFKAYTEYHNARKTGFVTPPNMSYYQYKRLHNTMGIYKFIVSEDMETLIYWAYIWGAYPTSCPRDAFQDPNFDNGLTFSVSFNSAFIEDMNPIILHQFNRLMLEGPMKKYSKNTSSKYLPVLLHNNPRLPIGYDGNIPLGGANASPSEHINGELPIAALITRNIDPNTGMNLPGYKIRWYGEN